MPNVIEARRDRKGEVRGFHFCNDHKHRKASISIDTSKQPHNLQIGIIAGEIFLHHEIAAEGNGIARQKHRDACPQRLLPAPCERISFQIIGQHQITDESGHVIEGAESIPVTSAQNIHVTPVSDVSQRRASIFR